MEPTGRNVLREQLETISDAVSHLENQRNKAESMHLMLKASENLDNQDLSHLSSSDSGELASAKSLYIEAV